MINIAMVQLLGKAFLDEKSCSTEGKGKKSKECLI